MATEYHIGRAWSGLSDLEEACPCPKAAPCGLVVQSQIVRGCSEHAGSRTLRQGHDLEHCPSKAGADSVETATVAEPFAFLGEHQRKTTDVECPQCTDGTCGCVGTLVPVCATDEEDWPCTVTRAFRAGQMAAYREVAGKLATFAGERRSARSTSLKRWAEVFETRADDIEAGRAEALS